VYSSRRQRKEWYDVVYERVPFFYFSCGIIGHSEIECPNPASRDENGCLPYSEKLRAPEERKMKNLGEWFVQGDSTRRSNSAGTWGSSESNKSTTRRCDVSDKCYKKEVEEDEEVEATSPNTNQGYLPDASRPHDIVLDDIPVDDNQNPLHSKKNVNLMRAF
jgi:hypothetical protein